MADTDAADDGGGSSGIDAVTLGRFVYTLAVALSGALVQQYVPQYVGFPAWPLVIGVALIWTVYYEWWLSSRGLSG